MNSGMPIFPTMIPNVVDPLWFCVDEPINEEIEIIKLESSHQNWLLTVVDKINDKDFPVPIGKTSNETLEEEDEEDEEEEINASDDSETHDEEEDDVEMDVTNTYDRDSPVSISTR